MKRKLKTDSVEGDVVPPALQESEPVLPPAPALFLSETVEGVAEAVAAAAAEAVAIEAEPVVEAAPLSPIVQVRVALSCRWSLVQSAGVLLGREWVEFRRDDKRLDEFRRTPLLEVQE